MKKLDLKIWHNKNFYTINEIAWLSIGYEPGSQSFDELEDSIKKNFAQEITTNLTDDIEQKKIKYHIVVELSGVETIQLTIKSIQNWFNINGEVCPQVFMPHGSESRDEKEALKYQLNNTVKEQIKEIELLQKKIKELESKIKADEINVKRGKKWRPAHDFRSPSLTEFYDFLESKRLTSGSDKEYKVNFIQIGNNKIDSSFKGSQLDNTIFRPKFLSDTNLKVAYTIITSKGYNKKSKKEE